MSSKVKQKIIAVDLLKKCALCSFTDEKGIIRVGGKIGEAVISYDTRHLVLLPRNNHILLLIARCYHEAGYDGVASTVAKVRERYWIVRDHDLAKTVKYRCVVMS